MTRKQADYGTVEHNGMDYYLQADAAPTSRALPDHLAGCIELSAPAIGDDDRAYNVFWLFEDDGSDLDQYEYNDVDRVEQIDVPVYLVMMVRQTDNTFDETHTNPETILRTLDVHTAEACMVTTEPAPCPGESDLDGHPYYLAPVVIRCWSDDVIMFL